jgi:hypothetical protein
MVNKARVVMREKVTLFSLVMTTTMVTGMSSLNLIWRGSWTVENFFSNFPILFIMAFALQSFVAMPLAKKATALHFEMTKKK